MKRIVIACLLSLAVPACSAAHRSTEVSPGIYDLTIRGEVDACSPARATGSMGEVGVAVTSGVLSLAVPDAIEVDPLRVSLSRDGGWHGEATVPLDGCVGATLERSWTVVDSGELRFSVAYREAWRGIEGCGEAMHLLLPEAPTADCTADLVLEYELMEACAAPCEVGVSFEGIACVCD